MTSSGWKLHPQITPTQTASFHLSLSPFYNKVVILQDYPQLKNDLIGMKSTPTNNTMPNLQFSSELVALFNQSCLVVVAVVVVVAMKYYISFISY